MGKKSKFLIWILTIPLICAVIFIGAKEGTVDHPLYAQVTSRSGSEKVELWYDDHFGTVYLFLPGNVELSEVQLKTSADGGYQIGGRIVSDGMNCEGFQLDTEYRIRAEDGLPYDGKKLVFMQSGGVSSLFVDVQSGSMDYLHEDKTHDEPGVVRLYGADGSLLYSGNADAVSGRGQSSWWGEEKKPYNITLHEEADLLGLGSGKKWALIANAKDSSHLRNKLVYDLATAAEIPYSPDCQWVNLYLNGEYAGLYLLCEKIELHPNRVDIPQEGSFLVTKDYPDRLGVFGADYFTTQADASLGIIHSDFSVEQLQNQWQATENAILEEDGIDPVSGKSWQELIDAGSWAKKFLLEETVGNIDAPMLSQYYYLDGSQENAKICASPPWDYEVAMTRPTNMIHVYRKNIYGGHWNWALYQKPVFYELLVQEYREVFRPLLLEAASSGLDTYARQMASAANMNNCRWHIPSVEEGISQVRKYLYQRTAFLDSVWLEEREYINVYLRGYGSVYAYLQELGTVLPELRNYDDESGIHPIGWFYEGTDIPVDLEEPMWEDTTVEFRWEVLPAEKSADPVESEPIPKSRFLAAAGFLVMLGILGFVDRLRFSREGDRT